ncbi:MAG TPA: NADH-quinone oxidoreductase subunit J [Holophagaceae bacterium]|nr:NADH-quinone oxidoreductase subunit J [Holophagaceae bacterium]
MFAVFALITLLGAVLMLLQKNVIQAGLCLALSFLGVAGLFVLLGNPVAGALQVIVYAGAILILVLFVIMLLNHHEEEPAERARPLQRWASVVLSALLGAGALALVLASPGLQALGAAGTPVEPMTLERVGTVLFRDHLLAVETVGLLLLAAMVGAVALVKKEL